MTNVKIEKNNYLTLILVICMVIANLISAKAQSSYDKLWKVVESYQSKDLPQSVLKQTDLIYRKAEKEQNFPQMLKAAMTRMAFREQLSPDSFKVDAQQMEEWLKQVKNPADAAILHVLLGSAYQMMAYQDFRDQDTRTNREQQAIDHYRASLNNREALASVTVTSYLPVVEKKKGSSIYGHDLLSMLTAFVAERLDDLGSSMNVASLYTQLYTFYQQKGNQDAALMAKLNELECRMHVEDYQKKIKKLSVLEYKSTLLDLIRENENSPVCADIYNRLLDIGPLTELERLNFAREAQQKYPDSGYLNHFKQVEQQVLQPVLSINAQGKLISDAPVRLIVKYKNCDDLVIKILEKKGLREVGIHKIQMSPSGDYTFREKGIQLDPLPAGVYKLIAESEGVTDTCSIRLTSFSLMALPLPDNRIRLTVVDSKTGHPVADCKLIVYKGNDWREKEKYKEINRLKTNESGVAIIDKVGNNLYVKAYIDRNDATDITSVNASYYYGKEQKDRTVIQLFTDRSIYRPGQVVHVGGIVYEQKKDSVEVATNRTYTIELKDTNWKVVASKNVVTGKMGSIDADLALPSSCLTGNFSIIMGSGRVSVKVEEYKKPTYQVNFLPLKGTYSLGNSLTLTGEAKTFSGAMVQSAKVKYTVKRRQGYWYRFFSHLDVNRDLDTGETSTDVNGQFSVPVFLDKEDLQLDNWCWNVNYVVQVEVTDIGGETQQGEFVLPLSKQSFRLSVDMPKQMLRSQLGEITIKAFNLKEEFVQVKGIYQVRKSGKEDSVEPLLKGVFDAGIPFKIKELQGLPSGDYTCSFVSIDEKGDSIKAEQTLVIYSGKKENMTLNKDWAYLTSKEFGPGCPVDLYFAPQEKNAYIFYDVFCGNKLIESRRLEPGENLECFHFDYQSSYGDGIQVVLMYVKNGERHQVYQSIVRSYPEKKLTLKWDTFRNKLYPGQTEEWRLSVKKPDGKSVEAELLATLYDASLDKINGHSWNMNLSFFRNIPSVSWFFHSSVLPGMWLQGRIPNFRWSERSFDRLKDIFGDSAENSRGLIFEGNFEPQVYNAPQGRVRLASPLLTKSSLVMSDGFDVEEKEKMQTDESANSEELDTSNLSVRKIFEETAFFYPHLFTDKEGIATISFSLPESLTEWKFMGLVHSEQMDYGLIEDKAIARKDFMVQPNMPRFVRVGDCASVVSRLINLSNKVVSGIVRMELINPETDTVIETQKKSFEIEKGETGKVDFDFEVTDKYPLLVCKIVADGKSFSDGEQNYLPVLTDKQWITESVPLTMREAGNKSFDLSSLFNQGSKTATQRKITIEFTQTPSWMILQSLSLLSVADNDNAISWSAAYYVNLMTDYLVAHLPKLKQVVDRWKQDDKEQHTLCSYLERNEELKDIVLEESPWLRNAMRETQQMKQLSELFNPNNLETKREMAFRKVKSLQQSDGSWSWYPGMSGSYYVTESVVEQLINAKSHCGNYKNEIDELLIKAFDYLDHFALKDYKETLKLKVKGCPSESMLHYLYLSVLSKRVPSKDVQEMQEYYVRWLAKSSTKLTIYGKAMSSTILAFFGKQAEAKKIVQSIREYSVVSPEMGRYFDTNIAYYSWQDYRIPTQVAAMNAMMTMKDSFSDTQSYMDEMSLWLIRQKQVQMWDNPIHTVQVISVLLPEKDSLWTMGSEPVVLAVDGEPVTYDTASAGLGYIKRSYPIVNKSVKTILVDKKSTGISWGAVYGQCLESMDNIKVQGSSIVLHRKLLVERIVNKQNCWEEVKEGEVLRVGDKVCFRITLSSDRDIDFLELKSQRAACMEPQQIASGYKWVNGQGYYEAVKDASTLYFFDTFRKGICTIDDISFINRTGKYQSGFATSRCAYSTEFGGHTSGFTVIVK